MGAARFRLGAFFALALISLLVGAMPAGAVSANLVISQVYGGGGNAGAQFTNDYIEIFNRGTSAADLTGLSVQYASATGSTWQKTDLSGQLSPGQHYLVQEAAGINPAVSLPTPDASGNISMSASSGKVALLANQTLLTCGATPNDCLANAALIDFAGYGTANNFEGSGAAPTLSNTTAALRSDQGCNDTDNNAADFSAGTPVPRNTASPTHSCVAEEAPAVTSTSPSDGATNVPVNSDITVNFSEPVNAAPDWYGIFCGTSLAHTAVVTGGPQSFTINPDTDFVPSETCTVTIKADHVSDQDTNDPPDNMTSNVNVTFATTANPDTPIGVVISQVYGGGGNAGAPFSNDFIELFNRSSAAVSLNGASVQYASATGTNWLVTALTNVTLQPKQYYLVQEAAGTSGGAALPAPDATGTTNMSATAGKVALVGGTTPLASCTGSAVADLVGYGSTASCFEGAGPAPAPSNTTAAMRNANGCTDTNNNASDFAASPPLPRNTASPLGNCDDQPPAVSATTPTSGATDVPLTSNITIQFSEAVNVADGWYSISCGTSGAHTAAVSGGPQNFTLNPDSDFATGETCTVTVVAANVTDQDTADPPDAMSGNYVWSFTTEAPLPPPVAIHEIQGAGHTSPRAGQAVANVNGFVTAKRSNGYYMQDPNPDADDATSEGIFVFTNSAPSVNVGDAVRVSGTVAEFRPGGASTTNLTTTEITAPTTSVLTTGNPLPPATVIGSGGRVPPSEVIENDASGSVETTGVFDPASDGIDFYETLEGMLLQVNNAVVVGPTNSRGEMFVLADDGAGAAARTARGGIVIRDLGPEPPGDYASGDFNPERIQLDDAAGVATPNANVGDHFMSPVVGVLDYDFGNFEIEVTSALARVPDGVTREVTAEPGANELSVATFNVENLDALEPQSKFDALAVEIVTNMRSPDVISLEEIQDNNGATNDSVVDADQTLNKLAAAIAAAGGPTYDWRQINPVDDQDGGEPGGNIRVGFMFRTDRGLAFVDRPGGGSTNATSVVDGSSGPELSFSPGRVDPTNTAWNASRKPLAGEFMYHGQKFFLITNHFNSKGGDEPLFGRFQPPTRSTEVQRHQQAQIVNNFVDAILAADSNANVVVLGDLNDFEFSQTVSILEGGVLHALMKTLPQNERYSYVFEGNSQSLDHIVVSDHVFGNPFTYDAVHVNAEFFDQLSDHDPQVARFVVNVNAAPSADAGDGYTVAEGGTVSLSASGNDPEGGPLTYAWDLDNNGSFETSGQTVTFSAAALDGPSSHTVHVQVTDNGGLTATDIATVNVTNVAPQATFSAPVSAFAGFAFTISLTNATDPSAEDTAAGFTYAFDCGDGAGYGDFGTSSSTSCTALDVGAVTVRGKIRDKDNGERPYTATVQVTVTYASLCALVRSYTSDQALADQLCQRLEQAQSARSANAKESHLERFRDRVDKSGAFTPTQAATLKRLSTRL